MRFALPPRPPPQPGAARPRMLGPGLGAGPGVTRAVKEDATMSRLVYLSGVGLLLVAGAFLVTDRLLGLGRRGHSIDRAHFDRLRAGMSRSQVEALLGGPAGDYCTGRSVFAL